MSLSDDIEACFRRLIRPTIRGPVTLTCEICRHQSRLAGPVYPGLIRIVCPACETQLAVELEAVPTRTT